jgi:ribonuclease HII
MPASAQCVQVTRDVALREFVHREQLQLSRDWGSGYPSGAVHSWQPCMCIPGTARTACACEVDLGAKHTQHICQYMFSATADPHTKAWLGAALEPLFGFPELTRFSWQTVSRLLEDRGPKVTW